MELSEVFKSLNLSDYLPKQMAFWIKTMTYIEKYCPLLEGPFLAENWLCTIVFSLLFAQH